MVPNKVNESNERQVWNTLYEKKLNKKPSKPKFKVDDRVRLNKKFRQFKKGYLPGWTEEVFIVSRVISRSELPLLKLKRWMMHLWKVLFTRKIYKTSPYRTMICIVWKKVLKRKGNKLLVRWKGWPDKYDIWFDKKDVK